MTPWRWRNRQKSNRKVRSGHGPAAADPLRSFESVCGSSNYIRLMTAYIANHQKKLRIFQKREEELRHAIRHDFGQDKIEKAAERLREAKFAVFKSKFSQHSVLPASQFSLEVAARSDPQVKRWLDLSTDQIIQNYSLPAD